MPDSRIKIMPPLLANQIAAGEVVERPASVVKELLENCLDAQATQISIDLEQAGIGRIRIRDNGQGIVKDDLGLALSRHATSKITHPDDLQAILSLGFRGEALASIASVAKVTLTSKSQNSTEAWALKSIPNQEDQLTPAAHPLGTSIEVEDLFFNIPARRKFLRSERTELLQIETVVKQLALSRHDIQFNLKHENSTLLQVPAVTTTEQKAQRIAAICGPAFVSKAREIHLGDEHLRLDGWLGLADTARSQNDMQYFFVNGRIVRDKVINHAVKMAYAELIPEGRYPCYVLYLQLPAEMVDVNVHPTKHEVRFYESRQVHDFLVFHLQKALLAHITNEPVMPAAEETTDSISLQFTAPPNFTPLTVAEKPNTYQRKAQLDFYAQALETKLANTAFTPAQKSLTDKIITAPKPTYKFLGSLEKGYLLAELPQGLWIINLEAALQLIAYLALNSTEKALVCQPLLLPIALTLTQSESEILETKLSQLKNIGIGLTRINEQRWLIRELAAVLKAFDLTAAIKFILQQKTEQPLDILSLIKMLSLTANFTLNHQAQIALLDQLMVLQEEEKQIIKIGKMLQWHEI